jgi:hypothetical protein
VSGRLCRKCGARRPLEEFARDRSKSSGVKSTCLACERAKSKAYYREHREEILEKAAAKRGRPRPPERTTCEECGKNLHGRQQVSCGSATCRDRRFKRLQPEAYAAREAAKVERRRERRRQLRAVFLAESQRGVERETAEKDRGDGS